MMMRRSWTNQEIDDFLSLRLPEEETVRRLKMLTPEAVEASVYLAFLDALKQRASWIPPVMVPTMECCGTGGSGLPRFNASTMCAFILAAGGVPTVKFGNRGISSRSGSFDLLEQLGIPDQWPLTALPEILETCNLTFLYAPQVYPDIAAFTALRRRLGIRTIFNYMGPLLTPITPTYRLLGVSHERMQEVLTEVVRQEPKTRRAWVVRALSGLDEIAPNGTTDIRSVTGDTVERETYTTQFSPEPFDTSGDHTPEHNHRLFQAIISGEDGQSAYHRISCLNAGAAFFLAGKAPSFEEGTLMAEDLLFHGKVAETVEKVRKVYARLRIN